MNMHIKKVRKLEKQDTLHGPQVIGKILMRYIVTSICRQNAFKGFDISQTCFFNPRPPSRLKGVCELGGFPLLFSVIYNDLMDNSLSQNA